MRLYAAAVFASAFLIFLVQPLVGKRILPWFGGVPSVWALCLAFYQSALFAGYAWAHGLIRHASPRVQLALHGALLAAALVALPILPGDAWRPAGGADPSLAILAMLAAHVALPFAALAATGPLLQAWFARRQPGRSPYPLYAVSNLGSLLALLAYPFWVEPRFALSATGRAWAAGFAATALAVLACGWLARSGGTATPAAPAGAAAPIDGPRAIASGPRALWAALAASAVVLLMGITNELCLDTASVPFLWILPLAVYLLSFIVCFSGERAYRRTPWLAAAALLTGLPVLLVPSSQSELAGALGSVPAQIARWTGTLFAICMVLHGELYRLRPPPQALTAFYLWIAGGGALGGLAVGIGAPLVFDGYYEVPLGVAAAWGLAVAAIWRDPASWLARKPTPVRWAAALAVACAVAAYAGQRIAREWDGDTLHQERSFFGVLRVVEQSSIGVRQLRHGTTLHGVQIQRNPRRPTSYYGIETGIGLALRQRLPGVPTEVGVVGLGAGTLASYGRPGDRFRFYEIDPAVIRIARDSGHFRFLADSRAQVEVIPGDGRISLAAERARGAARFDLLAVDAYSSDSVPVHLLTREALALYLASLEPSGLLAMHVSSRHLDLVPVLGRLGHEAGLEVLVVQVPNMPRRASGAAKWVFLSRDPAPIDALADAARARREAIGLRDGMGFVLRAEPGRFAAAPRWTDDYSDLLGALRRRRGVGTGAPDEPLP